MLVLCELWLFGSGETTGKLSHPAFYSEMTEGLVTVCKDICALNWQTVSAKQSCKPKGMQRVLRGDKSQKCPKWQQGMIGSTPLSFAPCVRMRMNVVAGIPILSICASIYC